MNPLMLIGILSMLAFALAFVLFANFSQKKILREQMRNQEQLSKHHEELLYSNLMTQEAERKRIARDLHDEIGSKLNIILLNTHRLKSKDNNDKEILEIMAEVESTINTTIDSTRRISHELLPPTLEDFGFIETMLELQYNMNKLEELSIEFNVLENHGAINDDLIELNLFRVLQELINNSLRHGKATEINVDFSVGKSNLKLSYSDNGVGFDKENIENKKGLGMKNIESRLQMIKADSDYQSAPGKGFQMLINLTNDV